MPSAAGAGAAPPCARPTCRTRGAPGVGGGERGERGGGAAVAPSLCDRSPAAPHLPQLRRDGLHPRVGGGDAVVGVEQQLQSRGVRAAELQHLPAWGHRGGSQRRATAAPCPPITAQTRGHISGTSVSRQWHISVTSPSHTAAVPRHSSPVLPRPADVTSLCHSSLVSPCHTCPTSRQCHVPISRPCSVPVSPPPCVPTSRWPRGPVSRRLTSPRLPLPLPRVTSVPHTGVTSALWHTP